MFVGEVLNFCEKIGYIIDNPIRSFVIDSRLVTQGDCFICFKGKNTDGHKFIEDAILKGASLIVASDPAEASKFRNRTNIALCKDPVNFLQQCAHYRRKKLNATFVTITGAVGKTTTKEFTRNLLEQKFSVFATPKNENNLLGVSLSLLNMPLTTQIAIIETGTNHFGEVGELTKLVKPHGTITTAIAPSHLEFFKTTEGVLLAETEQISWFQNRSGFWCINFDDKFLR
ncbi:MAG: Mur ligase family protein, partial [Deltaproteobacteria bacterium]|nr:Mur ligase family protein [Deltaproteobacteria bacterium]